MPRIFESTQASSLFRHGRGATLFLSSSGEPCASLPNSVDSRHVYPIRSGPFRDWLINNFYSEFEMAPSADALSSALRLLEARARYGDFPTQQLDHRLGYEGDPFLPSKIILDLANGEVLEIDSRVWRIRNNLAHSFRQSIPALPLPHPIAPPAGADPLQQFAQLFRLSDADRARVFAWFVTTLRPAGPYPILVLNGPSAAGKTVLARAMRSLIDPAAALLRRLPARDREILEVAQKNWILAFDEVQRIPSRIAAALCALSNGDALEIPQPDLRDPLVFQLARHIILVAPHDETQPAFTASRPLSNRTVCLRRTPLQKLRPESAIWSEFETIRPALLAALAHATVTALHRIRDIDVGNVPRFADCAAWAAAAAPALGFTERIVIDALTDPEAVWIGANPLRDALFAVIKPNSTWTGDAATLLNQLRIAAPRASLPNQPKGLTQALPAIPGIRLETVKNSQGGRILSVTRFTQIEQPLAANT